MPFYTTRKKTTLKKLATLKTQDCSDQRDGSILRKKRISCEKDAITFILENGLIEEYDFDTDGETNGVDD